ncbi:small ribosomal subunit Rsm22 family protein [bacterium]|nr:small ribosomal subunit Rsm22 family protein [bacterium]NUN45347.1 hypothetical protein [bacterium]
MRTGNWVMLYLPDDYIQRLGDFLQLHLDEPIPRTLKPFAEAITDISEGLKKKNKRSEFIRRIYLDQKVFRDAYLLYYGSINFPKIHIPLAEIQKSDFFNQKKNLRVLDAGSGTGSMLLGLAYWLKNETTLTAELTASDYASSSLDTLSAFYKALALPYPLRTQILNLNHAVPSENKFDLITAGNVLNELEPDAESHILPWLDAALAQDGLVIWIEPALMDLSRRLLTFRDRMLKEGWFLYSPCFTSNPCPALTEKTDWCHHDVPWQRPEFIRVLDGMTGHIRQSLKFTYIVMGKRDIHLSDVTIGNRDFLSTVRVVSERFEEKGRIRVFGCNDRGRCAYSMNKRDKSDDNSAFRKIERYDVVQLAETEEKSNYIGIGKNTKVHIVG